MVSYGIGVDPPRQTGGGTAYRNWSRQFGGTISRAQHRGAVQGGVSCWRTSRVWLMSIMASSVGASSLSATSTSRNSIASSPAAGCFCAMRARSPTPGTSSAPTWEKTLSWWCGTAAARSAPSSTCAATGVTGCAAPIPAMRPTSPVPIMAGRTATTGIWWVCPLCKRPTLVRSILHSGASFRWPNWTATRD